MRRYRFGKVKPLRAIIIYIAAIVVLGSLLAPWLYWIGNWLAQNWSVAESLQKYPFHRYFNRSVMLVAFIGLFWVVRALGIRRWADVGVRRKEGAWKEFGFGFVAGVVSMALLSGLAFLAGAQFLKTDLTASVIGAALGKALATGLVVGIIEEIFFRGAAHGGLRRGMSLAPAMVVSSFIFSIVHFLKPLPTPAGTEINWLSGFATLATCGRGSFSLPYFVTLLLAGAALAWSYEKTRTLHFPIGLHAGWVFALLLNPKLAEGSGNHVTWFGGGYIEKGWAAALLMAAALVVTIIVSVRVRKCSSAQMQQ